MLSHRALRRPWAIRRSIGLRHAGRRTGGTDSADDATVATRRRWASMMRRQPGGGTSSSGEPLTVPPAVATCSMGSVPHLSDDFNMVLDITIRPPVVFGIETLCSPQ